MAGFDDDEGSEPVTIPLSHAPRVSTPGDAHVPVGVGTSSVTASGSPSPVWDPAADTTTSLSPEEQEALVRRAAQDVNATVAAIPSPTPSTATAPQQDVSAVPPTTVAQTSTPPNQTPSLGTGETPVAVAYQAQQDAQAALADANAQPSSNSENVVSDGTPITTGSIQEFGYNVGQLRDIGYGYDVEAPGMLPHRFRERTHQVYYNEVILYIQGVDVSRWLTGNVDFSFNEGADPNTLSFTLNNALDRFVLTKENFDGKWRVAASTDPDDPEAIYSEYEKKKIYGFKSALANNPLDTLSGGRAWPLELDAPIFHKQDPVRAWIRNPLSVETDEYIPIFTGYISHCSYTRNYNNHESTLQIQCKDIRDLMRLMRVSENSVLYEQPGARLTANSSELDTGINGGPFSRNFWQDLVVVNSMFSNPWANVGLFDLISATTYGGRRPQDVITRASEAGRQTLDRQLQEARRQLQAVPSGSPNAGILQRTISTLETRLNEYNTRMSASGGQNRPTGPATGNTQPNPATQTPQEQQASSNFALSQAATNQAAAQNRPATDTVAATGPQQQQPSGSGQIGRMSRGQVYVYPKTTALITDDDSDPEGPDDNTALLSTWNSLLLYGFPNRTLTGNADDVVGGIPTTMNKVKDVSTCTYWTRAQVRSAGEATRSNYAWAPDTQMVHILRPKTGSTGDAVIQDNVFIDGSAVNVQIQWQTRLDLLTTACGNVDYRMFVTATGDLVFEFPQYDFSPRDYNHQNRVFGWQDVYEFEKHLLGETLEPEAGDCVNAVIAVGGITGYSQFAGGFAAELAPDAIPHAIVYNPVVTSRQGVNPKILPLPLITDSQRLEQIAAMEMQKLMGATTVYNLSTVYRPWLLPNRPVFNRKNPRFSLIEGIAHSVPVHGDGDPSTTLTLNYPRSLDQFGVPRFISGGPSLPIYYGDTPGRLEITDRISQRADLLAAASQARETLGPGATDADIIAYQREMGALPVSGYAAYNEVRAVSSTETDPALLDTNGVPLSADDLYRQLAVQTALLQEATVNEYLTPGERGDIARQIQQRIQEIGNQLESLGEIVSSGVQTQYGRTGFRTLSDDVATPDRALVSRDQQLPCDLDRYRFSSPLGRDASGSFPREIFRGFNVDTHPGVDYVAIAGEDVFAIADGTVEAVVNHPYYGRYVRIGHSDSLFSITAPVTTNLVAGDTVYRNGVLGTVANSQESRDHNQTILHLALGQTAVSSAETRPQRANPFVPPTVLPVPVSALRSARGFRASFYENRGAQRNAAATRIHGGIDMPCEINTPISMAAPGKIAKVYTNTAHGPQNTNDEGFGVQVVDACGAKHLYLHMVELPTVSGEAPEINSRDYAAGTGIGRVDTTGRSGGNHLHYHIELPGPGRRRVDISPRMMALFLGLEVTPEISKYEALHVYEKESGVQRPFTVPDSAPESPAPGYTVAQIFRMAGASASDNTRSRSHNHPPSPLFYNTASSPDDFGVPFAALPIGITTVEDLKIAVVGDVEAVRGSPLCARLQRRFREILGRRDIEVTGHGVSGSTTGQWLESGDVVASRPTRARGANADVLKDLASNYRVILVSLGQNDDLEDDAGFVTNAVAITRELSSMGSVVLWIRHRPFPVSKRVSSGRTIAQAMAAGVPQDSVDARLHGASVLNSHPEIPSVSALQDALGDRYYNPQKTAYNVRGAAVAAESITYQTISAMRNTVGSDATDSDTQTGGAELWTGAVPPESCPPDRQRRLQGVFA